MITIEKDKSPSLKDVLRYHVLEPLRGNLYRKRNFKITFFHYVK